jgi:LacI family transcriptional regulator
VDGVLLVPACCSAESVSFLQEHKVTVVILDRRVPNARVDIVRADSEQGAYQLVRHLLNLGHTRIAVLSGPQTVSTAVDRVTGYRRAMAEAGLDVDPELVYHGQFNQESGYEMTQQALTAAPRPTALFAANNFIAIGAFRALRDAGLQVPKDISMVSFDDLPTAMIMDPFLTTTSHPAYEMGQKATELLLARLASEGSEEPQEIVLPTQIIVRKSSCPPPTGHSYS